MQYGLRRVPPNSTSPERTKLAFSVPDSPWMPSGCEYAWDELSGRWHLLHYLMTCPLTPPAGATLTHSVGFIFSIYRQQLAGWTRKEMIRTQTKLDKGWEWSEACQRRELLCLIWEWGEGPKVILRLEVGTKLAVPLGDPLSGCPWRSSTISGPIYPSHPVPHTVLGMEQQQNRKAVPGLKEFTFWQKIHR